MGWESTIMTHTGRLVDVLRPDPANVCIGDIAHALSHICRYTGHVSRTYTVAEHCLHASYLGVGDPLACLMHDAAEAYIGDIATPLKRHMRAWCDSAWDWHKHISEVEANHIGAIAEALGIETMRVGSAEVKLADRIMLAAEASELLPAMGTPIWRPVFESVAEYTDQVRAAKQMIVSNGWTTPDELKHAFMRRFAELKNG